MDVDTIIHIGQQTVFSALTICAPILIASFVVGVFMSFIQAIFQIHEFTFSFVPKLLAIFVSMILYAPFMLSEIIRLSNTFFGEGFKFIK